MKTITIILFSLFVYSCTPDVTHGVDKVYKIEESKIVGYDKVVTDNFNAVIVPRGMYQIGDTIKFTK